MTLRTAGPFGAFAVFFAPDSLFLSSSPLGLHTAPRARLVFAGFADLPCPTVRDASARHVVRRGVPFRDVLALRAARRLPACLPARPRDTKTGPARHLLPGLPGPASATSSSRTFAGHHSTPASARAVPALRWSCASAVLASL